MKKLLSTLLAFSTISSTATSLVACNAGPHSNNDDEWNEHEREDQEQEVYSNWKKKMDSYTTEINWRELNYDLDNYDYQNNFNELKDKIYEIFLGAFDEVNTYGFQITFNLELSLSERGHVQFTLNYIKIDGVSFENFTVPWILEDDHYQENDRKAVNDVINRIDGSNYEAIIAANNTVDFFKNPTDINIKTYQDVIHDPDWSELQEIQDEFERSFWGASDINYNDPTFEIESESQQQNDWSQIKLNISLHAAARDEIFLDETIQKKLSFKVATLFNGEENTKNIQALQTACAVNGDDKFLLERKDLLKKDSDATELERKEVLKDFVNYCYQLNITGDEIIWDNDTGIWDLTNLAKYLPPFVDADGNAIIQVNFWENES